MRTAVAAALAAAALLAPASAGAVVPPGNLVVNPGAEAGAGSPDANQVVAPPGWVVTGPFTAVQYGAPDFLTAADSARLGGGVNFFAGGPTNPASAAAQTIDVSEAAPEIDAGKVTATLSALLGGYASQTDRATVTATFISATAASLGTISLQPVTAADRGSVTNLIPRSASGAVPAGTRGIAVRIDAIRDAGKGAFRTKGKYSSATVRGTKWLVEDSCSGTLTRVVRGTVTVRDQVRQKTIILKAGKSYRARAH